MHSCYINDDVNSKSLAMACQVITVPFLLLFLCVITETPACDGQQPMIDDATAYDVSTRSTYEGYTYKEASGHLYCDAAPDHSTTLWQYCAEENCNHCATEPDNILYCDGVSLTLLTTYCVTFNRSGSIEVGSCVFNAGNIHHVGNIGSHVYVPLPTNVSDLNHFMCGTIFNRDGTLCGKCHE